MASYHDWQIYDAALYSTHEVEDTEDASLGVALLVPLDANHCNDGSFRLTLFGGDANNDVCVPAEEIFPNLPMNLSGSDIHFPCNSARVLIPDNCTATPWNDVTTWLRNG